MASLSLSDLKRLSGKFKGEIETMQVNLNDHLQHGSMVKFANEMFSAKLIPSNVHKEANFNNMMGNFRSGFSLIMTIGNLETHCCTFLDVLEKMDCDMCDRFATNLEKSWVNIFEAKAPKTVSLTKLGKRYTTPSQVDDKQSSESDPGLFLRNESESTSDQYIYSEVIIPGSDIIPSYGASVTFPSRSSTNDIVTPLVGDNSPHPLSNNPVQARPPRLSLTSGRSHPPSQDGSPVVKRGIITSPSSVQSISPHGKRFPSLATDSSSPLHPEVRPLDGVDLTENLKEKLGNEVEELKKEKLIMEKEQKLLNAMASKKNRHIDYLEKCNKELKRDKLTMEKEQESLKAVTEEKDRHIDDLEKKNLKVFEELTSKVEELVAVKTQLSQYQEITSKMDELVLVKTQLRQYQEIELTKEKSGFGVLSTMKLAKKVSIGFLYAIFILLLLVTCWKPDSRIFIGTLPGVKVIASYEFLVAGGLSSQIYWEEYGLILDIPNDALPHGFLAKVVIRVSVSGPYVFPDSKTWTPASAVYWISSSKEFVSPILLGMWHNVKRTDNSSIKVLTVEDTPQNMSYTFNEYLGGYDVKGSYVYLKLTSFSGKTVVTSGVQNFQGSLYFKKSKGNKWYYSLVIYMSRVKGVTRHLLDESEYKGWSQQTKGFGVQFEENSTILELNITADPPIKNWKIWEQFAPLSYHKDDLQSQEYIESNMQFILQWRGGGPFLNDDYLRFSLKGAKRPTSITVNPTINHEIDSTKFTRKSKGMELDISNLNEIVSMLKDSNFEYSKWSDLGLKLGLLQTTLNTIKENNPKDAEACFKVTLEKWLNQVDNVDENGGATWNALLDALENIDQKPVAEKIRNRRLYCTNSKDCSTYE